MRQGKVSKPCAERRIGPWLDDVSARSATPGGGAAAALAASVGAALGAMAARYTGDDAAALLAELDAGRAACLAAVDEDAAAYAAWRRSRKLEAGSPEREAAEIRCRSAPLELLRRCVELNDALVSFLPWCNPQLACDCRAAIHLLSGAGRAAWQILLSNHPDPATRIRAQEFCDRLDSSDTSASSSPS